MSTGRSSGEGCGGFAFLVPILEMDSLFDLSLAVTRVVLEVYITPMHLRNRETKGDLLHLQVLFVNLE